MSDQEVNEIFSHKLKKYLDLKNMSQVEFAQEIGVSQQAVSLWLNGSRSPRMPVIDRICSFFEISRSDLMDHDKPAASSSEQALLLSYRRLDTIDQAKVQGYAEALLSTEKYKKPANEGLVS